MAILSLGPLILSDDVSTLAQSVFGNTKIGMVEPGMARCVMSGSDIVITGLLVAGTGGSRNSPFASGLLLLPGLAISLREPYDHVLGYVVAVTVVALFTVTSAKTQSYEERRTENPSFIIVAVGCLLLGTFTSWVTRAR